MSPVSLHTNHKQTIMKQLLHIIVVLLLGMLILTSCGGKSESSSSSGDIYVKKLRENWNEASGLTITNIKALEDTIPIYLDSDLIFEAPGLNWSVNYAKPYGDEDTTKYEYKIRQSSLERAKKDFSTKLAKRISHSHNSQKYGLVMMDVFNHNLQQDLKYLMVMTELNGDLKIIQAHEITEDVSFGAKCVTKYAPEYTNVKWLNDSTIDLTSLNEVDRFVFGEAIN